jgi:hypothetical protein
MKGEKDLPKLLKAMKPKHNIGDYVFCTVGELTSLNLDDVILLFKEQEGNTIVIKKELADSLKLEYSFIASWITLNVHSSLEAVGLTAAFFAEGISCNVVAAFYYDHIFVDKKYTEKQLRY